MTDSTKSALVIYSTHWCPDCFRVKSFLRERGVSFQEIDIEDDPDSEDLVIRVNGGKRRVPTLKVGDRYFACSPSAPKSLPMSWAFRSIDSPPDIRFRFQ